MFLHIDLLDPGRRNSKTTWKSEQRKVYCVFFQVITYKLIYSQISLYNKL